MGGCRGIGKDMRNYCLMGMEFQLGKMKKFWEDGDDSCKSVELKQLYMEIVKMVEINIMYILK